MTNNQVDRQTQATGTRIFEEALISSPAALDFSSFETNAPFFSHDQ